jgi:hypothetical protein
MIRKAWVTVRFAGCQDQPAAKLRPAAGMDDRVEVLYWSLWKEQRTGAGPLGRAALTIERAPEFIAAEDIFWTAS